MSPTSAGHASSIFADSGRFGTALTMSQPELLLLLWSCLDLTTVMPSLLVFLTLRCLHSPESYTQLLVSSWDCNTETTSLRRCVSFIGCPYRSVSSLNCVLRCTTYCTVTPQVTCGRWFLLV